MNQRYNAEQMLGVRSDASPEEITAAFQAKVSELSQKRLSSNEFKHELNGLYAAHDLLTKRGNDVINDSFRSFNPFGSFGLFNNSIRQMQHEMDSIFSQHYERMSNAHNQSQLNSQISDNQNPQTYKYSRSFSKSIKVDKDGNVMGTSNKVIENNGKVFEEEKKFDSVSQKMHVKRRGSDGIIKEYEKPYLKKPYNKSIE